MLCGWCQCGASFSGKKNAARYWYCRPYLALAALVASSWARERESWEGNVTSESFQASFGDDQRWVAQRSCNCWGGPRASLKGKASVDLCDSLWAFFWVFFFWGGFFWICPAESRVATIRLCKLTAMLWYTWKGLYKLTRSGPLWDNVLWSLKTQWTDLNSFEHVQSRKLDRILDHRGIHRTDIDRFLQLRVTWHNVFQSRPASVQIMQFDAICRCIDCIENWHILAHPGTS